MINILFGYQLRSSVDNDPMWISYYSKLRDKLLHLQCVPLKMTNTYYYKPEYFLSWRNILNLADDSRFSDTLSKLVQISHGIDVVISCKIRQKILLLKRNVMVSQVHFPNQNGSKWNTNNTSLQTLTYFLSRIVNE